MELILVFAGIAAFAFMGYVLGHENGYMECLEQREKQLENQINNNHANNS